MDAARARDNEWRNQVKHVVMRNFGRADDKLEVMVGQIEPRQLLERALNALHRIDIYSPGFLDDDGNSDLVSRINRLTYEMRREFKGN